MPELPEVETVRKQLEKEVIGSIVVALEVRDVRCYEGESWKGEEKIIKILRVGKYLFVVFESGRGFQVHLKMTGRLILKSQDSNSQNLNPLDYETAKHTRVVMDLKDGRKVYYWDTRMFGYIKLLKDVSSEHLQIKTKLGPEPWEIGDEELLLKLKRTGRAIKEAILDQGVLAGIGNIYANDGLWLAGINPRRTAKSLNLDEVRKLRASLCEVLKRGLKLGGASDNTYRDFYGGRGGYQNEFLTYGRTGKPCNKCGTKLKRIVVGGRGTWMCEECQK